MTTVLLEAFRHAYQNLQLLPLISDEDLQRFGVRHGEATLADLEQWLEDCGPENNKLIFTGHRGCGKSTLLARFSKKANDHFFAVFFSIADMVEMSDINHVNILFAIALQLMEEAEKRKIKIPTGTKKALYSWFSKQIKSEITTLESELQVGGDIEAGLSTWFAKFLSWMKSVLKLNRVIREEIRTEFARRIKDLVDRINDIATAIEAVSDQQILVVIDDLDKLDLALARQIYHENIQPLFQPHFRVIYTIPIAATRDLQVKGSLTSITNNPILALSTTKFFSRGEERQNVSPNPDAVACFQEVLYRRLSPELIETEIVEELILKSGGVLRELIRLASRCCSQCLKQLRRDPTITELKIDREVLKLGVRELRQEFTEPLGQEHFQVLITTYKEFAPPDIAQQEALDLLHNLHILEYRNEGTSINPHFSPSSVEKKVLRPDLCLIYALSQYGMFKPINNI